jgi:hypothetical protein
MVDESAINKRGDKAPYRILISIAMCKKKAKLRDIFIKRSTTLPLLYYNIIPWVPSAAPLKKKK